MRNLILNADDYGLTPGVGQGIRYAFISGALSSTTVMMNLPGAAREIETAKRDVPDLPIGVHLCLTIGNPITPRIRSRPWWMKQAGSFRGRVSSTGWKRFQRRKSDGNSARR